MSEILLVKLPDGKLEGLSDADKLAYKRFKSRLHNLEAGEICAIDAKLPRNGKYHRKFFKMLDLGYQSWEPKRQNKFYKGEPVAKNFEQFRSDVLIMAGHYDQSFGLDGKLKLVAKSISFAKMEQPEFEIIYNSVLDVLLAKVLKTYAGREEVNDVVDKILRFA